MILKLALLFLYPGICLFLGIVLYKIAPVKKVIKENKVFLLYVFILIIVVGGLIVGLHGKAENTIKTFDYMGFWRRSVEFNDMLFTDPGHALNYLYNSFYIDYSSLPACFMSLAMFIINKNSFAWFTLIMYIVFVVPAYLLLMILFLMICDHYQKNISKLKFVISAIVILFACNLYPIVLGYTGACGLPFIVYIVILIYLKIYEKINILYDIIIGLLFIVLVLLRRYYCYWVVGFFVGMFFSYLIVYFKDKNIKKIMIVLLNLFITGILPLLILIFPLNKLFHIITNTDYAFLYQPMANGNIIDNFKMLFFIYGWYIMVLFFWGVVYGVLKKELRLISLFLVTQYVFIFCTFCYVQSFGIQHYYLLNITMIIFIVFAHFSLLEYANDNIVKIVSLVTISLFMIQIITGFTFTKFKLNQVLSKLKPIISQTAFEPEYRNDVNTIKKIVNDLIVMSDTQWGYTYVLSSSVNFNCDSILNANFPENINPLPWLIYTKSWDFRDGLPADFFDYRYILTTDPIQVSYGKENQYVIWLLADLIMNDENVSKYYQLDTKNIYEIDGGIKVFIYKRISEIPLKTKEYVSDMFKEIYPDYPNLYTFN